MSTEEIKQQQDENVVKRLNIRVGSGKGVVHECEADFMTAPGKTGIVGIYPDHTKVVSLLREGEIVIKDNQVEGDKVIKVKEGLLQVNRDKVEVFIDEQLETVNDDA